MRMKGWRSSRAVLAVSLGLAAMVALGPATATADTVRQSGRVSFEVPTLPEDMVWTLEVNGQKYDLKAMVNTALGGRVTLAWEGSQEEPRSSVQPCRAGDSAHLVLLQAMTPDAFVWVEYLTSEGETIIGPFQVVTASMFADDVAMQWGCAGG